MGLDEKKRVVSSLLIYYSNYYVVTQGIHEKLKNIGNKLGPMEDEFDNNLDFYKYYINELEEKINLFDAD